MAEQFTQEEARIKELQNRNATIRAQILAFESQISQLDIAISTTPINIYVTVGTNKESRQEARPNPQYQALLSQRGVLESQRNGLMIQTDTNLNEITILLQKIKIGAEAFAKIREETDLKISIIRTDYQRRDEEIRRESSAKIDAARVEATTQVQLARQEALENVDAARVEATTQVQLARQEASENIAIARAEATRQVQLARQDADNKIEAARQEADRKIEAIRWEKAQQFTSLVGQVNQALGIQDIGQQISMETILPATSAEIQKITQETANKIAGFREQSDAKIERTIADANAKIERTIADANARIERTIIETDARIERTKIEADKKIADTIAETDAKIERIKKESDDKLEQFKKDTDAKIEAIKTDYEAKITGKELKIKELTILVIILGAAYLTAKKISQIRKSKTRALPERVTV